MYWAYANREYHLRRRVRVMTGLPGGMTLCEDVEGGARLFVHRDMLERAENQAGAEH